MCSGSRVGECGGGGGGGGSVTAAAANGAVAGVDRGRGSVALRCAGEAAADATPLRGLMGGLRWSRPNAEAAVGVVVVVVVVWWCVMGAGRRPLPAEVEAEVEAEAEADGGW